MTAKSDRLRLSADECVSSGSFIVRYLSRCTGDGLLFPPLFRDLLFPLFRECLKPENVSGDTRILLVLSHYKEIMESCADEAV